MGARQPKEERYFPRYLSVSKSFEGRLRLDEVDLDAQVLDVSRDGLGVLLSKPVEKGQNIELRAFERSIYFQVAHCHEDLIFKGKYRCGLHRAGSAENLVSLFRASGFIDDER